MAALNQLQVMESRSTPGIFLAMGWAVPADELALVLNRWKVGRGQVAIVSAPGRASEIAELQKHISGAEWLFAENVTEAEQIQAARDSFFEDGWLLSREGAVAMVAAQKISVGTRLVIDFQSPLGEAAELARTLDVKFPLRLPSGTKVGGIILPQ